jgi:hypothetical protein
MMTVWPAAFSAAFRYSGRSQASGLNSPDDARLLLDSAILTLENMSIQDEAVRKARVALKLARSS